MPDTWEFRWQAFCTRVIDGDTALFFIDDGFNTFGIKRIRLANINCPEVHGATRAAGIAATVFTQTWLEAAMADHCVTLNGDLSFDWPLQITTRKTDAFDRYVAIVWRDGDPISLNDALLASGNAIPFMVDNP